MKATDHELQKYDIFTRYGHRMSGMLLEPPDIMAGVRPALW
jgi:hypothetical protein